MPNGRSATFAEKCWINTALGTPIALEASAPLEQLANEDARPIVLLGGVHGDEPEGVELAQRALVWLRSQSPSVITPWVAVPVINPDGFSRGERVNGRGVDLNRNYPARDWSPSSASPRYFPGTAPGSEPETQGVVLLIRSLRPRLLIHCHSWEPCIVFTGGPGRSDADRLAKSSGYEARESIGYPTPGSLSSFGWKDSSIPVICIEEQEKAATLEGIWPRFAKGFAEVFGDRSARGPE